MAQLAKKILLFGANGQLGKQLKKDLKNYNLQSFTKTQCDICNKNKLINVFGDDRNMIVINAAAYTKVDQAEENYQRAFEINANALNFLSHLCNSTNSILIHFSTDYVFDGQKKHNYKEDDEPNPINKYGLSKLMGEKNIVNHAEKYYIFRTSWVYGLYGNNFASKMLELFKAKNEISVVDDQLGIPTSTHFISQVVEEFLKMIDKNQRLDYGLYNLVPNGKCSWYEFALFLHQEQNVISKNKLRPTNSFAFPSKARRPKFSVLSNNKLSKHLDIDVLNWKFYVKEFLKAKQS